MSTNSSWVGMIFADFARRAHTFSRSSGTATRPTLASRVENAYFVVSAAWVAVSALNKADLPTFGRPTIPQLKPIDFLYAKNHDRPPGSGPAAGQSRLIYGRALFMVGCAKIQRASHTVAPGEGRDPSIRLRADCEMDPGLRRDLFFFCRFVALGIEIGRG